MFGLKFSKDPLDSEYATTLLRGNWQNPQTTFVPKILLSSKLVKLLETKEKMGEGEIPVDWGCAELLSLWMYFRKWI